VDGSGTSESGAEARVTVEEASRLLGIERASVKKRIQRGKLRPERDASGTLYVFLDRSETVRDRSEDKSETSRDDLVEELRDRIRSLEGRLDEERESRRRSDTIIAQLSQANAEQARTIRELEAPAEEPREPPESPESVEEVADRGHAPQEPESAARRPWWRRVFGG
jgi:hypothetical protein